MSDVFDQVQAALLESEEYPETETRHALRAVVEFAATEGNATLEQFQRMVEKVWEEFEENR